MSLLDSMIEAHDSGSIRVVSENHNTNAINWVRGMSDPGEMIGCGMYQELRRQNGEADDAYQARIERLLDELPADHRERIERAGREAALQRASLNVNKGRVALMSARKLPWHGLGVVVDRAATSAEAIKLASLDWAVRKVPLSYTWNGIERPSKESFAIVRADTGKQLATVGSRYAPIQNADAFAFMDDLLGQYGARYETAGALYGGEKVFMLAHFPKQAFAVNGKDAVDPYVAICNPHDGSGCATCFPTSVRIECANTYRTAGQGAAKGLKIRHTGSVKSKLREAANALGLAVQSFDRFKDAAESMAHKTVQPIPYFNGVLDVVCDVTQAQLKAGFAPLDAAIEMTQAQLDLERKRFESAAEHRRDLLLDMINRYESRTNGVNGMRGTAWSAFNAVTESADHARSGRRVGSLDDQRSRRFENVLVGAADQLKQAAFDVAMKV